MSSSVDKTYRLLAWRMGVSHDRQPPGTIVTLGDDEALGLLALGVIEASDGSLAPDAPALQAAQAPAAPTPTEAPDAPDEVATSDSAPEATLSSRAARRAARRASLAPDGEPTP
jgi:hypothetical protein